MEVNDQQHNACALFQGGEPVCPRPSAVSTVHLSLLQQDGCSTAQVATEERRGNGEGGEARGFLSKPRANSQHDKKGER